MGREEGRENFIKMQISPSFVPSFLPSFLPQRCTTSARSPQPLSPGYPQFRADSAPRRRGFCEMSLASERGKWLRRDGKRRLTGADVQWSEWGYPCPQSICLSALQYTLLVHSLGISGFNSQTFSPIGLVSWLKCDRSRRNHYFGSCWRHCIEAWYKRPLSMRAA